MNRYLLPIVLVLFIQFLSAQDSDFLNNLHYGPQQNVCSAGEELRLDSIVTESIAIDDVTFDTTFLITAKSIYTYDWGRPLHPSTFERTSVFNEPERTSYQYDDNDNVLLETIERYETSIEEWVLQNTIQQIFSDDNLLVEMETLGYTNGFIDGRTKFTYEYDVQNRLMLRRRYVYDAVTEEYTSGRVRCYAYDSVTGYLASNSSKPNDDPSAEATSRIIYTHDDNGNLIISLTEVYDNVLQGFVPNSRIIYTPDAEGNLLEIEAQRYLNDEWNFGLKVTYTLNECGQITIRNLYGWESDLQIWVLRDINTYYYSGLSTTVETVSSSDILVFPNPALNQITIENISSSSKSQLIIMDISGRKLAEQTMDKVAVISLDNWSTGQYIFTIRSANHAHTGSFSKL